MRPCLAILIAVSCALLAGCGQSPTGRKSLTYASAHGKLGAMASYDRESDLDEVIRYVMVRDRNRDEFITANEIPFGEDVVKRADLNEDKQLSLWEIAFVIKDGICEIDDDGKLVLAPEVPGKESQYDIIKEQRDYYAANPDNGLNWYGNQTKVREIDAKMLAVAIRDAEEDPDEADNLKDLRDYYNNIAKPPFDGLGLQGHQQKLRTIEQEMVRIARDKNSLDLLLDLREFMTKSPFPNDGRSTEDRQKFVQTVNDAIDSVIGVTLARTPELASRAREMIHD
ncbi:MAG: hypothetical protein HY692_07895 [Cyanobacteria bacterium NC_groundwater_1444_Ag_S-0.65um_54_12]|nr:hypothetical protein [Cyanobacteria bacterium NC_groundwater_1444_Ag_S-0.65um_54_12]